MKLIILEDEFTVMKVSSLEDITLSKYTFVGVTDEEISYVCPMDKAPDSYLEREDGWRGFRIEGELDFSLIGILAPIADLLARNRIGIFVVSTYNTDYVFVKKESFDRTVNVLKEAGYSFQ